MKLTVDFSAEHKEQALETVKKLSEKVEKLELVPSDEEVFRISHEGKVIYDSESKDKLEQKLREMIK